MKNMTLTLTALAVSLGLATSVQAATHKVHHKTTHKYMACQPVAKKVHTTKKHTKKSLTHKATKKVTHRTTAYSHTTHMGSEINPNIPADLRINQTNNKVALPYDSTPDRVAPTSVVVPVTRVVQTAPATQVTHVQPVGGNTVKRTVTTTVPVAVETQPVVVPVVPAP